MKTKSAFGAESADSAPDRRQAQGGNDTLKIIVAVIFNLDSATFFPVMDRHMRAEVLLQLVLQILNRGRSGSQFTAALLSPWPRDSELARNHPLRRPHAGAAPQNSFRDEQLLLCRLQGEQHFRVTDRK